ncbi:hypothetical protein GN958_ATG06271 [Phytophthora infestans]|uniref:Uncharacterized protein n=1 Tax=Phytophthora infestans TaxID=4787 RepID=A0A8S9UU48_PHYIN|nr:hypothetical protein GN958_ATG06271 [Phytophthora infestans]
MSTSILRNLISFADEPNEECSSVSVKGDATYCIKGPVCGATAGACPAEGDAAVSNCVKSSRSFATGCIAPVDAQCVITPFNHWECVFPNISSVTTPPTLEAQATQQPTISTNKLALSASTESTSTPSGSENLVQGPNTALNIAVGVSCCVLALVGLVYVKKRRDAKKAQEDEYKFSPSEISIVMV